MKPTRIQQALTEDRADRPVLRFLLTLAGFVVGMEFLLNTEWVLHRVVGPELEFFAWLLGIGLEMLGETVNAGGVFVVTDRFSIEIVQGCDALRPVLLFVAAVIASPVRWWTKLPGIVFGAAVLVAANLIRLVLLYYVGVHFSLRVFDFMHRNVSQVAFILLVIFLWAAWALWAVRKSKYANPPRQADQNAGKPVFLEA